MKISKTSLVVVLVIALAIGFKTIVLRKPDTRLLYTIQNETFLETIQVSGTFHKTVTSALIALWYAA